MAKRESIDVICQHSKDGTVIPLKIRVQDKDGEYQAYAIQGFQEQEHRGGITTKDGVYISSHVTVYECQITTFGYRRRIRLYYDEQSGIWSMCGLS